MNDPWDVKSVRQSSQYLSCMKINGVPLLPPVGTALTVNESFGILAVEVSKDVQYRCHLANKAELTSKKLRVLNRARLHFTARHLLTLYTQVRPHMEKCSHLWAGPYRSALFESSTTQKSPKGCASIIDFVDRIRAGSSYEWWQLPPMNNFEWSPMDYLLQLSKECRKEMQYYKLLAKEVEKRISQLKPFVIESDSESSEDKTDAPELPESEQSYDLAPEEIQANFNINIEKVKAVTTNNGHIDSPKLSPDCTEVTKVSNITVDTDSSSKNTSKFVIDLSLSINETGRSILDNVRSPLNPIPPAELPERDCQCLPEVNLQRPNTINLNSNEVTKDAIKDKLGFNVSISRETLTDPIPNLSLNHDGPSSLSSKSFTGSLNDIHTDSVKDSKTIPLTRQRSYTVLKPSPLLLAHLEVQSLNTGIEMTSISMSESLSNLSLMNKKRRSWDLESAKVKWSSMALELKQKNIAKDEKPDGITKDQGNKTVAGKTPQSTPPRAKSVMQERPKHVNTTPKAVNKSEPIQRAKKSLSPVRNTPTNQNLAKTPTLSKTANQKSDPLSKTTQLISESEDPATRVRELYEKIQKQQLIQMANLVEKQKREQMLLQQVFEEQNNLLFTQLKTICPKSPNEIKEAWIDTIKEPADRGPVSLSQLINQKTPDNNVYNSPVSSTLTDTHNYINQCDSMLKKSRNITSGIKKGQRILNASQSREKAQLPKCNTDSSRTRTHSPAQRNATSRKLTYDSSLSSDRDYDPILTDRTNDTMADLNVTLPSDPSEDGHQHARNTNVAVVCQNSAAARAPSRRTEEVTGSAEESKPISIYSYGNRASKQNIYRPPTAQECAAATIIVAYAKGYLVRRLMRTERVQSTVQTIRDALLCALQLHQEREGIRGADVDLHRRLIQQITAACYALHDTFVASSPAERCAAIAADRGRRRSLAARPAPRHYKPTDIMSQSHSGVFPPRSKRPPAPLMTQSNYETFSGEKCLPSPRRRPWR